MKLACRTPLIPFSEFLSFGYAKKMNTKAKKKLYLAQQTRLAKPFLKRGGSSLSLGEERITEARRVTALPDSEFLDYVQSWVVPNSKNMKPLTYWVGINVRNDKRVVFAHRGQPNSRSHGKHFQSVVGPFRSARAALYYRDHGANNPKIRCAADAEKLCALRAASVFQRTARKLQRKKTKGRKARSNPFSPAQFNTLRREFARIQGVNPSRLEDFHALFAKMSTDQLVDLAKAKIKFVSKLAANAAFRRGVSADRILKNPRKDRKARRNPANGLTAYRITSSDGSSYVTSMAAGVTLDDAKKYFLGQVFTDERPNGKKNRRRVVKVEKVNSRAVVNPRLKKRRVSRKKTLRPARRSSPVRPSGTRKPAPRRRSQSKKK